MSRCTFVVCCLLAEFALAAEPAGPAPLGLARRTPWKTSRLVGSPDPPAPYRVERVFADLKVPCPMYIRAEPGTNNFFLLHQLFPWGGACRIRRFANDPAVTESEELLAQDRLIYGMTFHPQYEQNGYLFIVSNGPLAAANKQNRIVRYTVDRKPPHKIDPQSELVILEWDSNGHNGGDLGFGPDGLLYVPTGDGTSDSDTNDTGQGVNDLLAVMLRLDVDHPPPGKTYAVPRDNPFVDVPGARPEVWAFGFRNPWRMAFDPRRGHLWVGNNGQDLWEQVFFVRKGDNFGWSLYEGSHPFQLERQRGPTPIVKPAAEHHHTLFRSLTGGVVYYGPLTELDGTYVYGDWSTGRIWGVRHDGDKVTWNQELARTTLQIAGFGLSPQGDLLICDHGGGLYRLVRNQPDPAASQPFPRRLSETGLFESVREHRVHPGLVPYDVIAEQWADGARQERWLGLPGETRIDFTSRRNFDFANGTVFLKTLSVDTPDGGRRRIESQVLVRSMNEWAGYSYAWNDEQTDAELVEATGRDRTIVVREADGGDTSHRARKQTWHFASRTECMACHSRAAGFVVGFRPYQLNRRHDGPATDHQFRTLERLGVFKVNATVYLDEFPERRKKFLKDVWPDLSPLSKFAQRVAPAAHRVWTRLPAEMRPLLPVDVRAAQDAGPRLLAALRAELKERPQFGPWIAKRPDQFDRLVDPFDSSEDLDRRARSYLHANCAHCHTGAGGGNALMELNYDKPRDKMQLFDARPQHDKFGLIAPRLVAPGDPFASLLPYRMAKLGTGRMPRIGSSVVDERAVRLIADWIREQPPATAGSAASATDADRQALETARTRERETLDRLGSSALSSAERDTAVHDLLASTRGAFALLAAVDAGQLPHATKQAVVERAKGHALTPVRDLFERFVPLDERQARLGSVVDPGVILALEGDIQRGRHLFLNVEGLACKSCHHVVPGQNPSPDKVGPNLSDLGKRATREQILESVLDPSRKIDEKFRTYGVETQDGRVLVGVIVSRTEKELVLRDAQNKEFRLVASDLDNVRPMHKSLMPELLVRDLTPQQAADLLAFLGSLRE